MLQTNLEHITSVEEFEKTLADNENVMVCCGRMGPMCLPVYDVMESIEDEYPQVAFRDMAFDDPVATTIRSLPQTQSFMGLPFTVYFKNGEVIAASSSIQSVDQITEILDSKFSD